MQNASGFLAFFKNAAWIGGQRVRVYCSLLVLVFLGAVCALLLTLHQGMDWSGRPFGTDFISFWSVSDMVWQGRAADVYVLKHHAAEQLTLFPHIDRYGYTAFLYPPTFLLFCLPLALVPYFWSLFIWLSLTGFACWQGVKRFLPGKTPWVVIAGFPAIFVNILHGQNAFLSCALFAQGVYFFNKNPVLSGIFLGFLCFKPHLALCVPVVMVMARQWRALWAFVATVCLFVLVSWGIFGAATWEGFIRTIPFATDVLEKDYVGYAKMVSVFAAVRLLHGSILLSWICQISVNILVLSALIHIAMRRRASLETGMMLIVSALIVTPFLLDYDLMILAPVLAWSVSQAQKQGFMPYERFIVSCAFLLPMFARPVALLCHLSLSPLVLLALAYSVAQHGLREPDAVCVR